jgi:succinate dehydrogenase/fumarate reductase flavoprotein subunit
VELVAAEVAAEGSGEVDAGELVNLVTVAGALLASAWQRQESRGSHSRADFPERDPAWRLRLVHNAVPDEPQALP